MKLKSTIKIIAALALVVVILLVAGGLWVVNNSTVLLAKYKPQIEQTLSDTLKASVTLGAMKGRLLPSFSVIIEEVRIAPKEHPREQGFSLKDLVLEANLKALIGGKLEVTKLVISKPSITIRKTADGLSIAGLPSSKADSSAKPATTGSSKDKAEANPPSSSSPLAIDLQSIKVVDASVLFEDETTKQTYKVDNANLSAGVMIGNSGIQLNKIAFQARALDRINISAELPEVRVSPDSIVSEKVSLTLAKSSATLSFKYDVAAKRAAISNIQGRLDLGILKEFAPLARALKGLNITGEVIPSLDVAVGNSGELNASGNLKLSSITSTVGELAIADFAGKIGVDVKPSLMSASSNDLSLVLNKHPIRIDLAVTKGDNSLSLSNARIQAFSGTINATGKLDISAKRFANKLTITGLNVEQAMAAFMPNKPDLLAGRLENLSISTEGATQGDIPRSLVGDASLSFKDGALKGINIAGEVMRAINNLPFLNGSLYNAIPPSERKALDDPDTAIRSLTGNFGIGNGRLSTNDLVLVSSIFSLEAQGDAGFDGALNLKASIVFDKAFSNAIISKAKEARFLTDDQGSIVIPLEIKGIAPKLRVLPNLKKLAELGAKQAITEKASDLLEKLSKGGGKKSGLGKFLGGF